MQLFLEALDREVAELDANGVRLRFIGDRARLAPALVERMSAAEARTAAARPARPRGRRGLWRPLGPHAGGAATGGRCARRSGWTRECSTKQRCAACLTTAGRAQPDLFIRTGGERRISNFLLWDLAYTELWFTDTLWPDFDDATYDAALADFARPTTPIRPHRGPVAGQLMLGQRIRDGNRYRGACSRSYCSCCRARCAVAGLALLILAGAWEWSALAGLESAAWRGAAMSWPVRR